MQVLLEIIIDFLGYFFMVLIESGTHLLNLEQRRELMQAWADYLAQQPAG